MEWSVHTASSLLIQYIPLTCPTTNITRIQSLLTISCLHNIFHWSTCLPIILSCFPLLLWLPSLVSYLLPLKHYYPGIRLYLGQKLVIWLIPNEISMNKLIGTLPLKSLVKNLAPGWSNLGLLWVQWEDMHWIYPPRAGITSLSLFTCCFRSSSSCSFCCCFFHSSFIFC